MNFTTIVYLIIIVLYVIIATITILALVGKVEIKPSYMRVLFAKVILGIVAGFTFLFYNTDSITFSKSPSDLYAIEKLGQFTSFSVSQGDTVKAQINLPDKAAFKNILRKHEKVDGKLHILTEDSVYLGYTDISDLDGNNSLTVQNKLHLGLYYSQNNSVPGYSNLGVQYLTEVLKESKSAPELADAVRGLYNIVRSISSAENFKLLLKNMKIYLTPPSKHYEIAETFRTYYTATNTDRQAKYLGALKNYLQYYIDNPRIMQSDEASIKQKNQRMLENIKFYVLQLNKYYPELNNTTKIFSDLENNKTDDLQNLIGMLPAVDIDKLDSI